MQFNICVSLHKKFNIIHVVIINNVLLCLADVSKLAEMYTKSSYMIRELHAKESEINELKSKLQKNQDRIQLQASQLTTEKKMSKDFNVQFDFTVPATGEHDNHNTCIYL